MNTIVFNQGNGQRLVHSLLVGIVCLVFGSACGGSGSSATSAALSREIKIANLEGQPLETMLPKLHPDQRDYLEAFAATVPESLPEMAYVSSVLLNPSLPPSSDTAVIKRSGAYAEAQVGIANVGSNINQTNMLCLRNGVQVGCTSEVDVWQMTLSPKTMALAPVHISANAGDHLTFLFLANNESKRLEPASQILQAFVDRSLDTPSAWVDAPVHARVFGGCDFAVFVKDPSDTSTSPLDLFRHSDTPRGIILYLLIQLCKPTGQEYVQLVPIVDRTTVTNLPDQVWHSPIRLADVAAVIPIDTAFLGPAHEFQVAVIPVSKEASSALHHHYFTQAVSFSAVK